MKANNTQDSQLAADASIVTLSGTNDGKTVTVTVDLGKLTQAITGDVNVLRNIVNALGDPLIHRGNDTLLAPFYEDQPEPSFETVLAWLTQKGAPKGVKVSVSQSEDGPVADKNIKLLSQGVKSGKTLEQVAKAMSTILGYAVPASLDRQVHLQASAVNRANQRATKIAEEQAAAKAVMDAITNA